MFDAMGIYQHHDAVTGTAKQAVADYYAKHTSSAMYTNNEQYKKVIADFAGQEGLQTDKWKMCSVVNGTYADCPVHHRKEGWFGVTAHNPSAITQDMARIKVPPGHYYVEVFDDEAQNWMETNHQKVCYTYTENNWLSW